MKKLLIFLVIALCSACKIGDDDQVDRQIYGFTGPINLSNVKESYLPGDFIQITYTPPAGNAFTDTETGESVTVGNARISGLIEVFDPFVGATDTEKFDLGVQNGNVVENSDFAKDGIINFEVGCPEGNTYDLGITLSFLEPGGYFVFLEREEFSSQISFTDDSDCSLTDPFNLSNEADIGFLQFVFDEENTNLQAMEDYAAGFPDFPSGELEDLREALEAKRAYFVPVE